MVWSPVFGSMQVSRSVFSGSTLNAMASILFVPTAPLAVGTGAIGTVVLFLNCPQSNRPSVPLKCIAVKPVTAVKPGTDEQSLLVVGPVFAQSSPATAALALTSPSPPSDPCSMKLDGGDADTFMSPTTNASIARARMTPNRVGWRAISVMLLDNSITSFRFRGDLPLAPGAIYALNSQTYASAALLPWRRPSSNSGDMPEPPKDFSRST